MSPKRDRLDIIFEMLEYIDKHGNARITPLMYQIKISYSATKEYLNFLRALKLIEIVSEKPRIYRLTQKGIKFLENMRELKRLVKVEMFAQMGKNR